jgi:hypothetical protein
LLVPIAPGLVAPGAEWIEIGEGDAAYWHPPVDLAAASLPQGEQARPIEMLAPGALLALPEHAQVPAFVVGVTSDKGVNVGTDSGVNQSIHLVARHNGAYRVLLSAAVRGAGSGGRRFSAIGAMELVRGNGRLLDLRWIEHVTPGPNDRPFRPGPPLTVQHQFDGQRYVRH